MNGRTDILSIDLDDIDVAFADFTRKQLARDFRHTARADTVETLRVLERAGARATFFVNTQLAAEEPGFLRDIVAGGHDLASHGHRHFDLRTLRLDEFRDDLLESIDILSRYQPVVGYRAPSFTMPYRDDYFRVLLDAGLTYISNGTGVARSNAPLAARPVALDCGLVHVPISSRSLFGGLVHYPVGYGVASRLLPEPVYRATMKEWTRGNDFFHYYTHTFEIAGLPPASFRETWSHPTRGIYSLRCRNRQGFFERLFRENQFVSIEAGCGLRKTTPA
jgi:hypothetical protein